METYTLTFGDGAESHRGMNRIKGDFVKKGFTTLELNNFKTKFENMGADCKYFDLCEESGILNDDNLKDFGNFDAGILVIKKGVKYMLDNTGKTIDDVFEEQKGIKYDSKYWDDRREMICNKRAIREH